MSFCSLSLSLAVSRHQTIMKLFDKSPAIDETVFVAPSAAVIGDVKIGQNSSIWYGCVIRGQKQL